MQTYSPKITLGSAIAAGKRNSLVDRISNYCTPRILINALLLHARAPIECCVVEE